MQELHQSVNRRFFGPFRHSGFPNKYRQSGSFCFPPPVWHVACLSDRRLTRKQPQTETTIIHYERYKQYNAHDQHRACGSRLRVQQTRQQQSGLLPSGSARTGDASGDTEGCPPSGTQTASAAALSSHVVAQSATTSRRSRRQRRNRRRSSAGLISAEDECQ